MKRLKIKNRLLSGLVVAFLCLVPVTGWADDAEAVSEKEAPAAQETELDKLKKEWEAVREQQIQMIQEKEDQLEKLKNEIFAKMKSQDSQTATSPAVAPAVANAAAAVPSDRSELEAQKAALQVERQKFFKEMGRQKESLLQLQASLDEKSKQLQAEREHFESEKKAVAA